ncbi:hypothetical protein QQS21_005882 [Conoideocrella luteorostrata]|uniref:Uncharacterized protein n=1 Tax=Conoideocrella luteorostrata TaxID=1105319 RepID=A0AAJ0FTZ7_9HYPO|nr:hypothetical protein QQS21_005882 [Conoideocrella luteorostrata]
MRIIQILGALGVAAVAISAFPSESQSLGVSFSSATSSTPTSANVCNGIVPTSALQQSPGSANATTPFTTTTVPTTSPNVTASHPAEVTGGAIPQQMQASMAGLLGFCIMGLVML